MKHSKINLSDRKGKKLYNKRTHEIPEVEKEEESVRIKSHEVDKNLTWKQKSSYVIQILKNELEHKDFSHLIIKKPDSKSDTFPMIKYIQFFSHHFFQQK